MRQSIDNVNQNADARPDAVLELIHTVMHQLRSRQFQALRDGPHDLTHMEAKVLGYFARHAGATQSDLALHSGRDKAQLARLIKGLRERALLSAEADAADRRNQRLSLTPAGWALQQALKTQARQLGAQALTGLDAAERAQLQALLERLQGNLASGPG